ncbi:MAG: dihydrofolate reductase family protein [Vicinamibacterales bacterium]
MRTVIFGGANSLDNFLARPDGGVDWLRWNDGAAAIMKKMWRSIDTMLMGRKTYEVARRMAPHRKTSKTARPSKRKAKTDADAIPDVSTYVFSRTLPDEPGVAIVREDVGSFVRRLKAEPGKDILVMGGGELARSLFEANLIDRVGFNIHPVLLGAGVPAFHPMSHQIDLELVECGPLGNGCVYVDYRVLHV